MGNACSSGIVHFIWSEVPKDMAPKTTLEILRPDWPSLIERLVRFAEVTYTKTLLTYRVYSIMVTLMIV
jgi:hypothetical protein